MQEMNQGDEYEEEYENEDLNEDNGEGDENTDGNFDFIFGIPKKVFFVGAAIAVIVILGLVLLLSQKFKPKEEEEAVMAPTGETLETTDLYDESGSLIGTCDGIVDGYSVNASDGSILGYIDSVSGTTSLYDADGNEIGMYSEDTINEDYTDGESEEIPIEDIYNSEDIEFDEDNEKLRKAGYTGDEIELAKSLGIDTDTLIERSKDEQDKALKKRLEKVSDEKSKEFLKLYNNSMFCMNEITFDSYDDSSSVGRHYDGNYIVNADYWKCPTYGYQLQLKCKIADNTYAFYNIRPERWQTLPEEGNIVLQVNYTMYGTNNINMYITSIEEIDTTDITVNALDNAAPLDQIIQNSSSDDSDTLDEYSDSYIGEEDDTEEGVNEPW